MLFWNFLILVFLLLNVFYIPLNISFDLPISIQENVSYYVFLEFIPVWIFVVDIFISLNTPYYSKVIIFFFINYLLNNYFKSKFQREICGIRKDNLFALSLKKINK